MIIRKHIKGDAPSVAIYSDCEKYRYCLTRIWDDTGKRAVFVMLNPSTATEIENDPTVERCERRSRALGFGGFKVCNIFAYRATDPKDMRAQKNPIGRSNDKIILDAVNWADYIICAWGTHGAYLGRGQVVEALLRVQEKPLLHLGLSKQGHPKHPLYISYSQQLELWEYEN